MRTSFTLLIITLFCSQLSYGQSKVSTDHLVADNVLEVIAFEAEENTLDLFEKYEAELNIKTAFVNPYDVADISLEANITLPDGSVINYPVFYKETNTTTGESTWGFRISPRSEGSYEYQISITNGDLTTTTEAKSFDVAQTDEKGFLHKNGKENTNFVFDNGDTFRGIGMNIGWEARLSIGDDPKYTYDFWFDLMNQHNVNFVRTWVNAPWNLPLEWREPVFGRYSKHEDVGYHPEAIERMEFMINEAEDNDIYLMMAMDFHGAFWVNDNDGWGNNFWSENIYKELAGCVNPNDFFTMETAKHHYKNRIRYIVARWGYSTSVAAIEFFNEIDNVIHKEGQNVNDADVTTWHKEMGQYLRSIDYHEHIITTSISHIQVKGLFDLEELDLIQSHIYGATDQIPSNIRAFTSTYDNTYSVGEFGLSWDGSNKSESAWVKDLKYGTWLALFENTPIMPMSWWWEDYEKWEAYDAFEFLSEVTANMTPKTDADFKAVEITSTATQITSQTVLINQKDAHILLTNPTSAPISEFAIQVPNLADANYVVKIHDAYNFKVVQEEVKAAKNGKLTLTIDKVNGGQTLYLSILNEVRGDITDSDKEEKVNLKLFPNPTTGFLKLELDSKMNPRETSVQIYNTVGQLMLSTSYEEVLNLQFLQKGFYILKITDGTHFASTKFLKQ